MHELEKLFIQSSHEDILVYGLNKAFLYSVNEVIKSKNLTQRATAKFFGLKGKKPEKNLWEWKSGKVGIPLKAIRLLVEMDDKLVKRIEFCNLIFGERRSKHKIIIPSFNNDLAYLMGLISGDGNIQHYFIRIVDGQRENLEYVEALIKNQFNIPTRLRKESDNKWYLEINSKIICEFFDKVLEIPIGNKEKVAVPSLIKESNDEIKFAYIKGWIDAESSVEKWFKSKEKWYPRICFKVKNKKIWEWIIQELENKNIIVSKFIDIEYSFRFQILKLESLKLYVNYIGFLYPTKYNKINYLIKNFQTETLLPQ